MAGCINPVECPVCAGAGFTQPPADKEFHLDELCPRCEGEGWIDEDDDDEDAD